MKRAALAVALAALFILPVTVAAQASADERIDSHSNVGNPQVVQLYSEIARQNLPIAVVEDGSRVGEETPEERAQSLLTSEARIAVIERGELTAYLEHCGLDWHATSFVPFMEAAVKTGLSGKRRAYVGLLHGVTQGFQGRELARASAPCTEDITTRLIERATTVPLDPALFS